MLISTLLHKNGSGFVRAVLMPLYLLFCKLRASLCAYHRKKRSEHQLEQLDDYLLDDIGLRRVGDQIVRVNKPVCQNNDVGKQRKKRRLRHAYLFRRRRLNNSR